MFCLRGLQVAILWRVEAELVIFLRGPGVPEILQTLTYTTNENTNVGRKIMEDI